MKATQIHNDFVSLLRRHGKDNGFSCQPWFQGSRRFSRNILRISGAVDCLLYFKVRSAEPHRWGVTANRIKELKLSNERWAIILLFESAETGYFLWDREVEKYLSIWPLAGDGDYKVEPGKYLQYNRPFLSFSRFLDLLMDK